MVTFQGYLHGLAILQHGPGGVQRNAVAVLRGQSPAQSRLGITRQHHIQHSRHRGTHLHKETERQPLRGIGQIATRAYPVRANHGQFLGTRVAKLQTLAVHHQLFFTIPGC